LLYALAFVIRGFLTRNLEFVENDQFSIKTIIFRDNDIEYPGGVKRNYQYLL